MSGTKSSDRSKRLAGMFGGVDPDALAAQAQREKPPERQMTTAPTKALQTSFSNLEEQNLRLKAELEKAQVHELDPAKVYPSLVQDRFEWSDDDPDFQSLVASIESDGQHLPILVRPHPSDAGSYQIAYGLRRNRACSFLKRKVWAYVQELSDEELILAQGLENNERRNLSFIEQAVYARSLVRGGYSRKLICRALGVQGENNVSTMSAIAEQIPAAIVHLIGSCPKIGRTRWLSLADLFAKTGKSAEIEAAICGLPGTSVWDGADTNRRFDLALRTAQVAVNGKSSKHAPAKKTLSLSGRNIGTIEVSTSILKLTINAKSEPAFARFVAEKMDVLLDEFQTLDRPAARVAKDNGA